MSDYIERDKAINILDVIDVDIIPYADTRECVQSAIDYIRKELGDIPSARPNNRGVCGVCAGRKVCGENNRNLDMLECSIFELDEHYKISRPKGEWIPCSERLPKGQGYYICTCKDGPKYKRATVVKWSNGWQLTGARAYWIVLAWMPLPSAYQGE